MTGNTAPETVEDSELEESQVAEFLCRHPDFFDRNPSLLTDLRIPHHTGDAVSLVERQLEALRQETNRYKRRIRQLIEMVRDNEQLNQRLHQLTLSLIDAADFTELLNSLEDHLHDEFQADAVELKLFDGTGLQEADDSEPAKPELTAFLEFFELGQPLCGQLPPNQLGYLFGAQAEDVGSAALLPLQGDDILGVLAIGSSDEARFHPDMGTDFLVRLAEVVNHKLRAVSLPGV